MEKELKERNDKSDKAVLHFCRSFVVSNFLVLFSPFSTDMFNLNFTMFPVLNKVIVRPQIQKVTERTNKLST